MTAAAAPTSSLREPAEKQFAAELAALAKVDDRQRPPRWKLSPWAVVTYLMGGKLKNGTVITPKYIGNQRIIEIAVATLTTDRALLAARRAGHSEELGQRAPGGRDQRRLRPHGAGDGGGRRRRRSATAGTTRCCWPRGRRARRWCHRR